MDQVWDPAGEASAALDRVVAGFGQQVLERADMLEGLLQDEVPELPREVALLTAAARSRVAALLAERIKQGISPQAAVSMAAAEMTARTAVDASGAPWAAGVFAHALGHQVPALASRPDETRPTPDAPRSMPGGHADNLNQAMTAAPLPPAPTQERPVQEPAPTRRQPIPAQPGLDLADEPAKRLAIWTAAAAVIAAPTGLLFFLVLGVSYWNDWLWAVLLGVGLVVAAIWVARGWRRAIGFAAVLGMAAPAASLGIYLTSSAVDDSALAPARHHLLAAVSLIGLVAVFGALAMARAGVARSGQLRSPGADALPRIVAVAGVAYALANILPQDDFSGELTGNLLGSGVHGWQIVWGLAFIVLVSVPPVLAGFRLADPAARLAMLARWLLLTLVVQLINAPVYGLSPAPGLYLTWLLWLAILAGTIALARRRTVNH